MTPPLSSDDKRVILGGVIGAAIAVLLLLYSVTPRWVQLTNAGLSEPNDKATQIIGYDVQQGILYLQLRSGAVLGCQDLAESARQVNDCQIASYESAKQLLRESDQCNTGTLPTIMPPGVPVSQIESYPCTLDFGRHQVNHIVLADGTVWHLSLSITEGQEYWMVIIVIMFGVLGFAMGMIGTAIFITLGRRLRRFSK